MKKSLALLLILSGCVLLATPVFSAIGYPSGSGVYSGKNSGWVFEIPVGAGASAAEEDAASDSPVGIDGNEVPTGFYNPNTGR